MANINFDSFKINSLDKDGQGQDGIRKFVDKAVSLAVEEVLKTGHDRERPVVKFKTPEELSNELDLTLSSDPVTHKDLLQCCRDIIEFSVKTGHPRFFNQLYGGIDPYGFTGEVLTNALNTSMYTFEVAPVFTLLEKELMNKMMSIVCFDGEGTFCPGGSYSNMMGMNLARFNKFPNYRETGMRRLPRMVIFTSEDSHYSTKKNSALLGFAASDVVQIKCNKSGKMDVEHLKELVQQTITEGDVPLMVNATAGTTVLGAFDPLNEIADCCEKHSMWMHVDASWGGGMMMSSKHKHLCKGIERSDSIAWNPHKLLMAPLQCCVFLTKKKGVLKSCNSIKVPYLFQPDKKAYDPVFDTGTQLLQCGRKVDCLKLWLMWKAKGDLGFAKHIDHVMEVSRYLVKKIKTTSGFRLVLDNPECTNVCFWFIPPRLRERKENEKFNQELNEVAPKIKAKMMASGSMLVGYQPHKSFPNFFRMVVVNTNTSKQDMDFVVNEIATLGADL